MANIFATEGLTTTQMGRLLKVFKSVEGSAEERWAETKKYFPLCTNLDEGFKAWCFKQNGIPLVKPDPKKLDPLK